MRRDALIGVGFVAFVFVLSGSAPGEESEAARLLGEGNAAYSEKDYATAAQKYERILQSGTRNGVAEFNLANAYFRMGELGKAILHYERARRFLPRNGDVLQNLKVARRQCEDQIKQERSNAVVLFFDRICSHLTANEWGGATSIVVFLLGGLITLRSFCRNGMTRRRLRHGGVILGILAVWFGINTGVQTQRLRVPTAVIMEPEVKLYAEPNSGAEARHLFLLHEGSKVTVERSEGDWALVRYAGGLRGFCREDAIARI